MSNADLKKRKDAATPRGVGVMCDFYADRAENAELWDIEGNRYIDFASGIAVLNTGHRHPRLMKAIAEQMDRFTHTCYQVVPYESYVELAEKVNELSPGTGPKKTAFFTTGAEAVENAIKVARAFTGRPSVIAFNSAFHGRTLLGMALTGKVNPYKLGFGPFPGDIYHALYPNAQAGVTIEDAKEALKHLFLADVDPKRVAAIILEPVQGEGGFNVCPPEFMRFLRETCDEHGILLVADEVQTGFGRTGKLFAMEHYDVQPDLTTMAKSLAGGMPLSGLSGRADVMDAAAPGGLGGTYAGNPLAVASALAVIDTIEEENLLARGAELGDLLQARLNDIAKDVKTICEVRGLGAMVAVEFRDPETGKAAAQLVKDIQNRALANKLILLTCGIEGNVIRFLFPLTITDAVMAEALDILEAAIRG
ncbi:4-aminobutyrate--2-oxoglutarate transaminase [Paenalcaligenes suwonensis]|uniref:4-aminobutyrate--2-oxoglutarate transaminase n=1 Tax=Paenalcaligenes suwonensis TaxID=1202713 RepID=UPI001407EF0B|nr:4-aminobutyrate--2-oxoglutarate transaminase [Paenalcaligenes suwonensis]NHC60885.1 4-aminobutyrate--2-oxoglutarate transaminase [Paenalcaligenes suwonensis]